MIHISAHERAVEAREILTKLQKTEFAPLVRALTEEPRCFTHTGRINCSAVARHLGIATSDAGKMLAMAREQRGTWF